MSYSIGDKNEILLTRGDTFVCTVSMVMPDGTEYVPSGGDTVRFALKRASMRSDRSEFRDEEPLIVKVIPNETRELRLDPSDTKHLGFGSYKYDVEITFDNGFVATFIADSDFKLLPEID